VKYYRLDPEGTTRAQRLETIKTHLAAGLPSMFGFTVYSSIPGGGDGKGEIPYPKPGEKVAGGHAILAVGYNDTKKIGASKGALLIRNSWGTGWGDAGYGWLPYDYVLRVWRTTSGRWRRRTSSIRTSSSEAMGGGPWAQKGSRASIRTPRERCRGSSRRPRRTLQ
jgi:hypothetical protein